MDTIIDYVWSLDKLRPSHKLVLLAIAKHANVHDSAYPGLRRLQRLTGLSLSQVCVILPELAQEGYLHIAHGAGPGGTNLYTILRQTAPLTRAPASATVPVPAVLRSPEPNREQNEKTLRPVSQELQSPEHRPAVRPPLTEHDRATVASYGLSPTFLAALTEEAATTPPAPIPITQARRKRGSTRTYPGPLCPLGHDDGTGHTQYVRGSDLCRACQQAQVLSRNPQPQQG